MNRGKGCNASGARVLGQANGSSKSLVTDARTLLGCSRGCAGITFNQEFSWTRAPSLNELHFAELPQPKINRTLAVDLDKALRRERGRLYAFTMQRLYATGVAAVALAIAPRSP